MKKGNWLSVAISCSLCAALLVGCGQTASSSVPSASSGSSASVSSASSASESSANIVKGADITAPAGETLMVRPVDKVSPKKIKIATVAMNTNPFDLSVYQGIKFAQQVLKDRNVDCEFVSIKEQTITQYEQAIRNCIATGCDAITCNGFSEQLAPLIAEAKKQNIPFFTFNNPAGDNNESVGYWGQSGFDGGVQLANLAVKLINNQGKYAIITGSFNLSGHEDRRKGFRSVADKLPGMKLVGEYENHDLADNAYKLTTNLLTANPDLACLYVTAGGPDGAAKAIQDAGKTGKVVMVCHDWMPNTVKYIRSGVIAGCLDQDPFNQGYAPIIAAYNYLVGNVTPEKVNLIKGTIATPANVGKLIPES